MLKGKKIILGITGSIAAYKAAITVRLLVKAGASVKVIMTPAAAGFIAPLSLATLSRNEVLTELADNDSWANHVMLGRWADLMLIAPLTCNSLSKMAHGACDNLLMAVYLSATCPVGVAPAMDEDMWKHPATRNNITTIKAFGNFVLPVNTGELASGLTGEGRMAEPEQILEWVTDFFTASSALKGKRVLVTAGPTYESIDPVRFIGNHSTGKMGIALANEFSKRGAHVTLVLGPSQEEIPSGVEVTRVTSAGEMWEAAIEAFPATDIAVLCAAVADYTPVESATQKIKKTEDILVLELKKTGDILKRLGEMKTAGQYLVGFALETNNEVANAKTKLKDKNADMIVLNSLNDPGAGFGHSTNKITIFDIRGGEHQFETKSKRSLATDIVNTIITNTYA